MPRFFALNEAKDKDGKPVALKYTWGAQEKVLPPGETQLEKGEAEHAVSKLQSRGVSFVEKP